MELPLLKATHLVYAVRSLYLLCCIAILVARFSPSLRKRFLAYGPRLQSQNVSSTPAKQDPNEGLASAVLNWIAGLHVPHSWFAHFYVLSVALSCGILGNVLVMKNDLWYTSQHAPTTLPGWPANMVICIALMLIQGFRRLLECLYMLKPSQSTMWVGHYAFGIAFYTMTNTAIWVEARAQSSQSIETSFGLHPRFCPHKTQVGVLVFILASAIQFTTHAHLASLKKYTLPRGGLFRVLVTPHYTAECLIYISIAIVAAPSGMLFNRTFLCTVVLAAVNLGITAEGTKTWMLTKFRDDREEISSRYCLIPGLW